MQFEPHNIIEHTLNICVEFFAEGAGADLKLLVPLD